MGETNGHGKPKPEWLERLERVEASHVQLMTDHEVFRREHDEFVRRYDAQRDADREEWKARGEAMDRRIEALITAMGSFIGEGNRPKRP
jgi:hypothetical protein